MRPPKHPITLTSRDFMEHDYAYYQWLRTHAPVCKGKYNPFMTVYLISRYEDVARILKDPRFVRNRSLIKGGGQRTAIPLPKTLRLLSLNMILSDEPDHRRLRTLVQKAFTPATVANLAPRVEALTHRLLDEALRQRTVDLVTAYALPIPVTVIAEMVGVPEAERPHFLRWSQSVGVVPTLRTLVPWYRAVRNLIRYTRDLITRRRASPQEDLLTALIEAEEAGQTLSEDELVSMVILLLIAGFETTVNLIANGTHALLTHPDQLALLRTEPERLESAVEEMMRYNSPVQSTEMCYPTEDVTLHGVTIPRGATVLPLVGSANRDESVFEDADRFDITRPPTKNIAFGHGIHYCLGAPLARLEGQIAFRTLLARCPDLRLAIAPQQVRYRPQPLWHRLEQLPVVFT